VAQQMADQLERALEPRGVIVENVLLRNIRLPDTLEQAIEAKQQAEQDAQRMQFVLQKELLEWKAIEATEKLVGPNPMTFPGQ